MITGLISFIVYILSGNFPPGEFRFDRFRLCWFVIIFRSTMPASNESY
jgi:hypothetical protein